MSPITGNAEHDTKILHPDPIRDAMANVLFAAILRAEVITETGLIATFINVPESVVRKHYQDAQALAADRYRKFCNFINEHPYG